MTAAAQLGPAPRRRMLTEEQVRRMVAEQFPQWAHLPVRAVRPGGWDNQTFRLGSTMSVRVPSATEYALAVEKEQHWLPRFAAQLPFPIPTPLGRGEPTPDQPFAWSVYRWLDGTPAGADQIAEPVRFALDLAGFLAALQRVDPDGGPRPGTHSWFRGGTLATFDATTEDALAVLRERIDVGLVGEIWQAARAAPWDGVPTWFHGDVAEGNLLLRDGSLAAVIDFGTCGVGDPSCDLAVAWTLLTDEGRRVFRDHLGIDHDTWARGRGWALWKTLTGCATAAGSDDREAPAWRVLQQIAAEYRSSNL